MGFDLGISCLYDYSVHEFVPNTSLAAMLRPAPRINTMLFGEVSLFSLHAGLAQGIPVSGREVMTLSLATGLHYTWAGGGDWNYQWRPLLLGSVSWHGRTSGHRITPGLVCGHYWNEPSMWLLGVTVSAAARQDDDSN